MTTLTEDALRLMARHEGTVVELVTFVRTIEVIRDAGQHHSADRLKELLGSYDQAGRDLIEFYRINRAAIAFDMVAAMGGRKVS